MNMIKKNIFRGVAALLILASCMLAQGQHPGVSVTLTSSATNYQLSALVVAVESTVPVTFSELTLLADSTNTAPILFGDSTLSATQYGGSLAAGVAYTERCGDGTNCIVLAQIYVRSSGAGQVLHVSGRVK